MERQPHRVALFGYPLGHSVSPAMHHAAAAALGLDLTYELWPVSSAALAGAVTTLRGESWLGANVTLPHKPAMVRLVDGASALARRIGAINTLYKREDRLLGENTDAPALLRCLRETLGLQPAAERVLVLGAGGAARATVVALLDAGVRSITLWNRTPEHAQALLAAVQDGDVAGRHSTTAVADGDPRSALAETTLVINATSVGLDGQRSPLPDLPAGAGRRLFDLVYGPGATPLVRQARAGGWQAEDGLWMLVYQAARAFELWTGRQPPEHTMYEAATASLAARVQSHSGEVGT